jgi:hypothetical protein
MKIRPLINIKGTIMNSKFFFAIAQSDDIDSTDAANDVIDRCMHQLNGRKPSAGLIYMGITIDHHAVLDIIHERIGDVDLIGCTTDGEFSSETGYIQDSILLVLVCSDEVKFVSGIIDFRKNDSETIEIEIRKSLEAADRKPVLGILFSDGLILNGEDSLNLLNTLFDERVPFFGGAAADKYRFTGTKQFYGNTVLEGAAVYLLFCGEFDYSYAIGTGWEAIGPSGIVNKAEGNIIKEINNIKAVDFYRDFLGQEAAPSIDVPMAVFDENGSYLYLRTTLFNTVGEDGSIPFLGNISEGCRVRLTVTDRDSILKGTEKAVNTALKRYPESGKPSAAVCFSCTVRRAILGLRTDEECRTVQSRLGDDVVVFGFYTYGEFAPPGTGKKSTFHNESFICLLLE